MCLSHLQSTHSHEIPITLQELLYLHEDLLHLLTELIITVVGTTDGSHQRPALRAQGAQTAVDQVGRVDLLQTGHLGHALLMHGPPSIVGDGFVLQVELLDLRLVVGDDPWGSGDDLNGGGWC